MIANSDVITVDIQDALDLPPTPGVLCDMAKTFEDAGYAKLARYLRACADGLAAHPPMPQAIAAVMPLAVVSLCVTWLEPASMHRPSRYMALIEVENDACTALPMGDSYALVSAPLLTRAAEAAQANLRG